jgi:flavodoxin
MKKILVVYDSMHGNTEKVAHAIAGALAPEAAVEVRRAGEVASEALGAVDLLIIGSPTQGFRPTRPMIDLLKRVSTGGLKGVKAAAFDTRFEAGKMDSGALRLLIKTGGYAAPRIGAALRKAGGIIVLPPEGFFVEDTEGPLKGGELDRAAAWAKSVLQAG